LVKLSKIVNTWLEQIRQRIIVDQRTLDGWEVRNAKYIDPGNYEYLDECWRKLDVGDTWARQGQTAFMQRAARVPAEWSGKRVGLEMKTGGEGLLKLNGQPYHGVDDWRGYILLTPMARGNEEYNFEIEIKTGAYWEYVASDPRQPYVLSEARLVVVDQTLEQLYYDFKIIFDTAEALRDPLLQDAMFIALKKALQEVDFRTQNHSEFTASVARGRDMLQKSVSELRFGDCPGKAFLIGHSHIDVAWLWPLKETMRKVGRTYSTCMALMDEYPNYNFVCSQVPLFLYLKEHFPDIYEKVKLRVADGRFELVGGTWVEHDCNVLSGESLVRQCLYGQRFFKNEFGADVRIGWLPDVFGYSWALPQIYKKAGLDYFMTSKLSWNDTNRIPYTTFWWQGIDGTRIFTHLIHGPYNNEAQPRELLQTWDEHTAKLECPEYLFTYGYGDGGGGPTRSMLENVSRLSDIPGLPKADTGSAHDFFDRIAAKTDWLPVWNGELYFEMHRGTYTSQAWNKRYNRQAELLLRDVEMWSAAGAMYGLSYPKEDVARNWQTVLLNQFHDIVPGSSINEVYRVSREQYREVLASSLDLREAAQQELTKHIDTEGEGTPVVVFNSLSWPRTDLVSVEIDGGDGYCVVSPDGSEAQCQVSKGSVSFLAKDVPSCGYAVYHLVPRHGDLLGSDPNLADAFSSSSVLGVAGSQNNMPEFDGEVVRQSSPSLGAATLDLPEEDDDECPFIVDGDRITSEFYVIQLAHDGTITRLYDRINKREVIAAGARANVMQIFDDRPSKEEAWDLELHYQDKGWEFTQSGPVRVSESGSDRLVLDRTLAFNDSTIRQKMVLYAYSPRIDFINEVDWQERKAVLKVAFPVEVHSSRATYEIPFGAIERPTHWNTSWDLARFEMSGHRWADLSETGYGVSVLNDCKYGWDIKDNVIRLTLLRAPEYPDPEGDKGRHEFVYSLLPHTGDWTESTVWSAMELNSPLVAVPAEPHPGKLGVNHSFLGIDSLNVIIDTAKCAEDGDELVIRVYESTGARGPACISFDRGIESAVECNLLEEEISSVQFSDSKIRFNVRPFDLRTFKVKLAQGRE